MWSYENTREAFRGLKMLKLSLFFELFHTWTWNACYWIFKLINYLFLWEVERRWEAWFLSYRRLPCEVKNEELNRKFETRGDHSCLGGTRRQNIHSCQRWTQLGILGGKVKPVGYRHQVSSKQWFRTQETFQWRDWKHGKGWPAGWLQHHPLPAVVWALSIV